MTSIPPQPNMPPSRPPDQAVAEALDPANQSLADALRKSFAILKLVMLVLVVLYFLSGWFSVKPDEAGVVLRYGRIVGADRFAEGAALPPGWHWSWPYPFERWVTVSTNERELPIEFMFQLTDEERTGGITGYRHDNLSPLRDDYLITGDVNIIHASVTVKYQITDPVAYLTNVLPMPRRGATVRSPAFQRYPEYTVLRAIARNAVIETAAYREALDIRGAGQDVFLQHVAQRISDKLEALEREGRSLGITVDPVTGVLAPKVGGTIEAIMPPRQVQEAFDRVFGAFSEKSSAITRARADAQRMFLETAGQEYGALASAVEREFELLLRLSERESELRDPFVGDGAGPQDAPPKSASPEAQADTQRIEELTAELAAQRELVESLLVRASGQVQAILKSAEIRRDQMTKEASGDWDQFRRLLPEYRRHPTIFMSRMREETYAEALANERIGKIFVPEPPEGRGGRIWLKIPRVSVAPMADAEGERDGRRTESRRTGRQLGRGEAVRSPPTLVGPSAR